MKINNLTATAYRATADTLTIQLPQGQYTTEEVEAAFADKASVRVTTDNEQKAQTVETLRGYKYIDQYDGHTLLLTKTPHDLSWYKQKKLAEIDQYDHTTEEFTMQGDTLWLDWNKRDQLRSRLDNEEAQGLTDTTLWNGTTAYTLPITEARQILAAVEAYAIKTYDMTAWHKSEVLSLDTAEAVQQYDHTTGYPDKLTF